MGSLGGSYGGVVGVYVKNKDSPTPDLPTIPFATSLF